MTLSTLSDGLPYCSNLFYAVLLGDGELVFTSSLSTEHGKNMVVESRVAGSIVLETKVVGKIRGLQLSAEVSQPTGEKLAQARSAYLKRFPYAVFADLELWCFKITKAKLTDNRLGFGKKDIWSRDV